MKRRTLDLTLATIGLVMAAVLAIASALLLFAASFTNTTITDQLSAQRISFGPAESMPAAEYGDLVQYAGQQVTTGTQAKAYSDYIAVHLDKMADGQTYSEVSGQWIASAENPADRDPALGQLRQTLFMGETLRGLLLNVYAFSIFGTVALIAGWVAAVAALVMLGLAIYGFSHAHKLHKQELLEAPSVESIPVA
ncbi:hypothetical protein [Longivirga aurantiaca]|uniref:Aromatic ring-opening dioxygenase LigA n=1 Tax=Longivirga aurantiaca TaxID=1837743 RepID=A0ABW1T1Q3_9ACTN